MTSGWCHEACLNSNAARAPGGSASRNRSSTSRLLRNDGGNWNNSVPSLSPRMPAASQKARVTSTQSASRASWVMRRGALSVKRKRGGVTSAQPASRRSVGSR